MQSVFIPFLCPAVWKRPTCQHPVQAFFPFLDFSSISRLLIGCTREVAANVISSFFLAQALQRVVVKGLLLSEWKKKYVCLYGDGRLTYHHTQKDYRDKPSHGKEVERQIVSSSCKSLEASADWCMFRCSSAWRRYVLLGDSDPETRSVEWRPASPRRRARQTRSARWLSECTRRGGVMQVRLRGFSPLKALVQ